MQTILSDYNCEGHAQQIMFALRRNKLDDIVPLHLRTFSDIGLAQNASDEIVWRLCQEKRYLLLTGNRRTVDGEGSLELTIRRLYTATILPVVTIGDMNRVYRDRNYCEQCAVRLAEIALDLEAFRGVARLYLP